MKSKYHQWSGVPPSLVLSRPTWNTSNCNAWKASLLETVFLIGVMVNAFVPEIQMPLRLRLYKKLPWKTPWKTRHQIDMLGPPNKIFFLEDQSTRLKHHEIPSYIQEENSSNFLSNASIFFSVKVVGKKCPCIKLTSQLLLRWIWAQGDSQLGSFCFWKRHETGRSCHKLT